MISIGIDIGTTTLRATAVNVTTTSFGERKVEILPSVPLCQLTPLRDGNLEEAAVLSALENWMKREQVPEPAMGTVLFTGEAQRATNCGMWICTWTIQWKRDGRHPCPHHATRNRAFKSQATSA